MADENKNKEYSLTVPADEAVQFVDLKKEFKLLKGTIKIFFSNEVVLFLLVLDFYSDKGLSFDEIISNYNYTVDKEITDKLKELGY